MNVSTVSGSRVGLVTLRRLAQARQPQEICELCSVVLSGDHRHLLEAANRKIVCACPACALRFENVVGGRYKLIPRDVRKVPGFHISDSEWDGLAIPIGLAFFFYSTPHGRTTVLYPSPAGAMESALTLQSWEGLTANYAELDTMQKDVEALLVNRTKDPHEYYIVPIDLCFELVGVIRMHWRGLSGGENVWQQIEQFFQRLCAGVRS